MPIIMGKGSTPSRSKPASSGPVMAIAIVVIVVAVLAVGLFLFRGKQASSDRAQVQKIEEQFRTQTGITPDQSPSQFKKFKGMKKKEMKTGGSAGGM